MNLFRKKRFRTMRAPFRSSTHVRHAHRVLGGNLIRSLVDMAMASRADEISCDECGERLAEFAELTLAGKSAAEAIPLVQNHLDRCTECREEFEALLLVLQQPDDPPAPARI